MVHVEPSQALRDWLDSQVGKGRKFPSFRQLAFAAGLSENQAGTVYKRGTAKAESLMKLAAALGESSLKLFRLSGWVTQEDINSEATTDVAENPDEQKLVDDYRNLGPEEKRALQIVIRGLRKSTNGGPGQTEATA